MSIIDPVVSDPDIAPGAPPPVFSEPTSGSAAAPPGARSLILATLEFDTGNKRYSGREVIHPSYTYQGKLLDAGFFDRSIAVPAGDYQGSDGQFSIADTDGELRNILATEMVLRRKARMRLVREGTSESAVPDFIVQEIDSFKYKKATGHGRSRETAFTWMDREINRLGNRENFDLMDGVDAFFFPIFLGQRSEVAAGSPPSPQGLFKLPRMTLSRWALSQTPMISVSIVRKGVTDGAFLLVDPAEYVVTEEPYSIEGIDYSLTFIDFLAPQDEGVEIRLTAYEGNSFQGAWGVIPAYDTAPLPTRNPIAILINFEYLGTANQPLIADFNSQSYLDTMNKLATVFGESPASGYLCDVAITEPTTFREAIGKICRSFEIDRYVNREGQITVSVVLEDDENAPVLSDGPIFGEPTDNSLILLNSVEQSTASPIVTRLRYNFAPNLTISDYTEKKVFNDTAGQALTAGPSSVRSGIIESTLNMDYVSDPVTALHVAARRMDYLAPGSFRIEMEAPLPEVFGLLELGQLVKVTHRWGLAPGGFRRMSVKISGLVYDLMRRVCVIRGVLRVPQVFGFPLVCPIAPIAVGEVYSAFLWPTQYLPLTWTVVAGELPEGLTLDAATGEISGTPLYAGTYNWTIRASDESYSPPRTQDISCQHDVQEGACGLLSGEWRHNARVGPFYVGDNQFAGILIEDGRLIAKVSATGMQGFSNVDDVQTAPASPIGSFDVQEVDE